MTKRTQIYLSMGQWKNLSSLAFETGQSVSDLIRGAIDQVYKKKRTSHFEAALKQISGIWKDRQDISGTKKYLRELRKGKRLETLYDKKHG